MKAISIQALATALTLAVAAALAGQLSAGHGGELVKFPENYAEGVLYATVARGNVKEEIFTSRAAVDAVRPIPSGTVITPVDYSVTQEEQPGLELKRGARRTDAGQGPLRWRVSPRLESVRGTRVCPARMRDPPRPARCTPPHLADRDPPSGADQERVECRLPLRGSTTSAWSRHCSE